MTGLKNPIDGPHCSATPVLGGVGKRVLRLYLSVLVA